MKPAKSILVIDDEESICLAFEQYFASRGWQVRLAASAEEGLAAARELRPSVVFLDVRLPDRSGLDLLEDLAAQEAGVVVITAYGGLQTVVRAIHGRAFDYLVKPLDLAKALALAERIWQSRPGPAVAVEAAPADNRGVLVGNSPRMQDVYKLIARAAVSTSCVLIRGETGTGKEMVARAIHQFSGRQGGPFVAVNCGAIPENLVESELFGHVRGAFTGAETDRAGRFESANAGTLLLDEVGELPPAAQVKLLRVLDTSVIERVGSSRSIRLDVRILAATNRDLVREVEQGRFRQDLYYRLAVLHIPLPPLRERKEDILPLAQHFLQQSAAGGAAPPKLDARAAEVLLRHDWPGNVRELKNALEHAVAIAPNRTILADDLPELVQHARGQGQNGQMPNGQAASGRAMNGQAIGGQAAGGQAASLPDQLRAIVRQYAAEAGAGGDIYHRAIQHVERSLIEQAMERFGGNQSEAADYLGLHRNTLRTKLRELGIGPEA